MQSWTRKIVTTLLAVGGAIAFAESGYAADVRRFEENGVVIEETRKIEKVPVAEVQMQEQTITRYTDKVVNEVRPQTQSYYVPITEYRLVPRLQNRWNPFAQPQWVYDRVPTVRYELRTVTSNVPITRREQVPESQVVQTPVRTLRFVDKEQVSRIVLGPAPANGNPTMVAQLPGGPVTANNPAFGNSPPVGYGGPGSQSLPPSNPGFAPQGGPVTSGMPPNNPLPVGNSPSSTYGPTDNVPSTNGTNGVPGSGGFNPTAANGFSAQRPPFNPNGNNIPASGPTYSMQSPPMTAARQAPLYGGVSRFDSDPPRQPFPASIGNPAVFR